MAYKRPTKNLNFEPVMDFLEKYWFIILGLIIAVPWIKNYLAEMQLKNKKDALSNVVEEKETIYQTNKEIKLIENLNPLAQKDKRYKITGSSELWAASQKLAHDFGVIYADSGKWYDFMNPRGWTENDESIRDTLLKYRNYFNILEKLYFQVDTNSRSLRADILKHLDPKELALVRKGLKI